MSISKEYKAAYESVFLSHSWGNKSNTGVNYKRPYSKTKKQLKEVK